MSLVCVGSQKGAPGVTATVLALTVAWQRTTRRQALLLEADPAGGVLAVRYRLGVEPGLLTLAAAVRAGRHLEGGSVWAHAQRLAGNLPVVVGPDGPDQAHAGLRAAGEGLGDWLNGFPYLDVIADVGRLDVGSPAEPLARRAEVVLIVARPRVEQLQPAARRLTSLARDCRRVGWVLIGEDPHRASEVEAVYGFDVVGVLADDPRAVEGLEGAISSRQVARSALYRSASSLASDLVSWWLNNETTTARSPNVWPVAGPIGESGSATVGLSRAMAAAIGEQSRRDRADGEGSGHGRG